MTEARASVLVVGGSGYVGSAVSAWLMDHGHHVIVLDNLSTGHLETTLSHRFYRGHAGDRALVDRILNEHQVDCVLHFAAKSLVAESVQKPKEYFENNVVETETLIETMLSRGVTRLVFSSTCAIFRDLGNQPIAEHAATGPASPYGETKLEAERRIQRITETRGLKAVCLRYFNAAGAEPQIRVGEWHENESHLIPRILGAAKAGAPVSIFGSDYQTRDGTAVRDYIHVTDLARAHESAMQLLLQDKAPEGSFEGINLGSGSGYTVREIVKTCESVLGHSLVVKKEARRAGDLPHLVANPEYSQKRLRFKPAFGIKEMIESASRWQDRLAARMSTGRAVFLDRDGTLNPDPGYIHTPEQFELYPTVPEALKLLQQAGFKLVIVSNQSGVGRGLIPPENLKKIHDKLDRLLEPFAVRIDSYSLCTHRPEENCACRKPKPKLILDAAAHLWVDVSKSYMIGDKRVDFEAGRAAGCRESLIVLTGEGKGTEGMLKSEANTPARFFPDLLAAARWISTNSERK